MEKIRFLPLLTPLISLFLLELFYFKYKLIYLSVFLLFILFYFTVDNFLKYSKVKESLLGLLLLPTYYTIGLVSFSVMISDGRLVQFLFLLNVLFLHFYFLIIYNYLINCEKYKQGTLENFSSHGNFIAMYFIASSVYGLQSLVNFSVVLLILVLLIFLVAVVHQVFWVNKIKNKTGQIYIFISILVIMQLAVALWFLTLSFYILGLLLAIYYYTLIGLIRFYLLGDFRRNIVKLYFILGFSSILIVLLTARWF